MSALIIGIRSKNRRFGIIRRFRRPEPEILLAQVSSRWRA
jgi:hypothetical protein